MRPRLLRARCNVRLAGSPVCVLDWLAFAQETVLGKDPRPHTRRRGMPPGHPYRPCKARPRLSALNALALQVLQAPSSRGLPLPQECQGGVARHWL
jgi:hypothetical protein